MTPGPFLGGPRARITDYGFEEHERRYYRAARWTLADLRYGTERSITQRFSAERFNPEPPIADQEAPTP